jgi:hypothetical protein
MIDIQIMLEEVGGGKDILDVQVRLTGEGRHVLAWILERFGRTEHPNLDDVKSLAKWLKYY